MILTKTKSFGGDSMYLKIIGCTFIFIGSSLIGFFYGENFKKRFSQLKEFEQALYQLKSEIVYTHNSLPDIFNNMIFKCSYPIKNIFIQVSDLLYENKVESVYEAFKKSFELNKEKLNLKKRDIDIILNLSKSLGESDIEGQKNILTLTLKDIKKQIDNAEVDMNKNVKMYRYLGFSFGVILIIIIL